MSVGITMEELLAWNVEASDFWKTHLDANPALLELPCDIGGAADVQQFVRHIWGVELRWAQRLAGLPVMPKEEKVSGQLEALFEFHLKAVEIFRELLTAPDQSWEEDFALDFKWIPPETRVVSRRKVLGHALFHSQRHWAQLATLVRAAGFPSGFKGDLLLSPALR